MSIKHLLILPGVLAIALSSCEKKHTPVGTNVKKKDGMIRITGGSTEMGSSGEFDTPYGHSEFPEESPPRKIEVKGFWIDETEVTNAQFAIFVKATKYVTFAERPANIEDFIEEARTHLPKPPFDQGAIVLRPTTSTSAA